MELQITRSTIEWRGYVYETQTKSPFEVNPSTDKGKPRNNNSSIGGAEDEESESDEFELEISDDWKERLAKTHRRVQQRNRSKRKSADKQDVQNNILALEQQLDDRYADALAALALQESLK